MEIFLVKEKSLNPEVLNSNPFLKVHINIGEDGRQATNENPLYEEYRKKIVSASEEYLKRTGRSLCIHLKPNRSEAESYAHGYNQNNRLVRVHGFLWEESNLLQVEGLKIRTQLSFHHGRYKCDISADIPITQASPVKTDNINLQTERCIGSDRFSETLAILNYKIHTGPKTQAVATISLLSDNPQFLTLCENALAVIDSDEIDVMRITRKILALKIHPDIVISSNDGTDFPCNKPFLAAHSQVLAKMIGEMKGSDSNHLKIVMPDMTSDGVKAFLEYVYTCDLDQEREKCEIAFELLQAGHKYEMKTLVKKILSILTTKEVTWFNIDMVFGLFLFTRKIDIMNELKMKSASILLAKRKEFLGCKTYKKKLSEDAVEATDAIQELFCLQL